MIRALVLADTHIRPGRSRRLPDAVYDELQHVDVILHAGDVLTQDLLDELAGFAPVHAVLGNNDAGLVGCPRASPSTSKAFASRWSTRPARRRDGPPAYAAVFPTRPW